MTEIDGFTRVCGLIGLPVAHSLSPLLHNYAYSRLGLNYRYLAYPVQPDDLQPALRGLTALNFSGVNVTAPHKEAVIPFIDRLDPVAAATGSVNTICCREGKLEGYSTDGEGFLWSLQEEGNYVSAGKSVLLLGAGGAARAVSYALAAQGINSLTILNRSEHRANSLAEKLQALFPSLSLKAALLTTGSVKCYLPQVSLIVNSLSGDPWPWEEMAASFYEGTLVYDLRYSLCRTGFINWAEKSGAKVLNGLGMLLAQAALSFELFTGVEPPFKLMKKVLTEVNC
ncbi:MAG TPA: shikimate dehydrogenase [Firmicutes bacterium]|nr:shikimate dehydrogenase [Bacillota bacterium]